MLLEQVCQIGKTLAGKPKNGRDWEGLAGMFWSTSATRSNTIDHGQPFNTYKQSVFKMLLKTNNGRIMNSYDMPIIRMLEDELFTYKLYRARLFECDWKNNDINI